MSETMPERIWAVPYEDMAHGEWDESKWQKRDTRYDLYLGGGTWKFDGGDTTPQIKDTEGK